MKHQTVSKRVTSTVNERRRVSRFNRNGLTSKEQLVADIYLADPNRNGTHTYRLVYPRSSAKSAETNASRMLRSARVRAYLERRESGLAEKYRLKQEELLQHLSHAIHRDPRRVFDTDGQVLPMEHWGEAEIAALDRRYRGVAGQEVSVRHEDGAESKEIPVRVVIRRIRFVDKLGALVNAMRYL